jgi:hypothetical protein
MRGPVDLKPCEASVVWKESASKNSQSLVNLVTVSQLQRQLQNVEVYGNTIAYDCVDCRLCLFPLNWKSYIPLTKYSFHHCGVTGQCGEFDNSEIH